MTWRDHRPLLRYRIISGLSCFVLVCTFVLFLLVGLSLPIIKPVYLLVVRSTAPQSVPTSIATELRFGVWGMCASSAREDNVACIGPQLGYEVPEYLVALSPFPAVVIQAVQQSLLVVLVLHPVAAGLVFLAAFASLFLGSHAFSIFVLVLTIIATILATVVLGVDLALVLTAKNQVADLNRDVEIVFGNGIWMMVVAVALVWLAVILLSARACYCCGVRRHHHHHHHHDEY
ncbi:hypothetical protein MD484_g1825, partial [Candolleomyces efflorescens]